MDASTVIVCFKVAIKREQDQSCRSAQELVEECSTWMKGVVSNIYAYQAIHSLWPAVYIYNFPRQICHYTHYPVSANRKICQHINKCLYEEQTNISLSEIKIKYQWHGCQMFICTQTGLYWDKGSDNFSTILNLLRAKLWKGDPRMDWQVHREENRKAKEENKWKINGISRNLFVLQKLLRYQHHLSDYQWQICVNEIQHCHCCKYQANMLSYVWSPKILSNTIENYCYR